MSCDLRFKTAEETICAQVKLLVYSLNPLDLCQTQEPVTRSKMNPRVFLFGYRLVFDIVMNTEPQNHHALFSPLLIWREKLKTSAGELPDCGLVLNLLGELGWERSVLITVQR